MPRITCKFCTRHHPFCARPNDGVGSGVPCARRRGCASRSRRRSRANAPKVGARRGGTHPRPSSTCHLPSTSSRSTAQRASRSPKPIEPSDLLVHAHRDRHPVEITAQFLASRLIHLTGNEGLVKLGLKGIERLGSSVGRTVAGVTGNPADAKRVARLLGVRTRDYAFQFREPTHLSEREVKARVADLQKQARARLAALGKRPRLRVLLTGATGFLGKEFLAQAAAHPYVDEVVCVVRQGDDPRPQDEGGREGALGARARGAPAEAAARDGEGGVALPLRRGRHRAARLRDRRQRAGAAAARADPRRALRGERLVRRPLRELVPLQRARLQERARVLEAGPGGARRRTSWRTWRSRPPTSTAAASARSRRSTRSCSRATSTTTTTSSRRRWRRSRPTAPSCRTACA